MIHTNRLHKVISSLILLSAFTTVSQSAVASGDGRDQTVVFRGTCDASGAVPLTSSSFMVADDEDNTLRVYDAHKGGFPIESFSLAKAWKNPSNGPSAKLGIEDELDLEAATELAGVTYWLTSHARNRKGREKPERYYFFGLTYDADSKSLQLEGKPYDDLLEAMIRQPDFQPYRLDKAATRAAEADHAVNIEGMTARLEGGVYIGFRNPVPDGKALVVPLDNPKGVIHGESPKFGKPLELDLEGLGIRGLSSWRGQYIIAAGDSGDDDSRSVLFRWRGGDDQPERVATKLPAGFNPEAFFTPENLERFMILSDDGGVSKGGTSCKKIKDPGEQAFRGLWLDTL